MVSLLSTGECDKASSCHKVNGHLIKFQCPLWWLSSHSDLTGNWQDFHQGTDVLISIECPLSGNGLSNVIVKPCPL